MILSDQPATMWCAMAHDLSSDDKPEGLEKRELPSKARRTDSKAGSSPKQGWNKGNSKTISIPSLTAKQDRFARLVASGTSLSEAYRSSYNVSDNTPDKTTWADASALAKHPLVSKRINSLKAVVFNDDWQDMNKLRATALKTLHTEALGVGEDTKSSSRVAAAVAIGKITEIDLFTEHSVREVIDHRSINQLKDKLEQRFKALFDKAQPSPVAALTRQTTETDGQPAHDGSTDPTPPGSPV